jgi:hypothetical protein
MGLDRPLAAALRGQRLGRVAIASPGRPPTVLMPALKARILEDPSAASGGSTHWSTRVLKIDYNHVRNAWTRNGLQPHRFERYKRSDEPDFEAKSCGYRCYRESTE